jgi:hypothetical protein
MSQKPPDLAMSVKWIYNAESLLGTMPNVLSELEVSGRATASLAHTSKITHVTRSHVSRGFCNKNFWDIFITPQNICFIRIAKNKN